MSLWDRYLAPGDVRAQQQALAAQHAEVEKQAVKTALTTTPRRPATRVDAATRARRQNGLLFGGIMFTAFSVFVTRRAVARKLGSTSVAPPVDGVSPSVVGGLDAAQALTLATINVFSIGALAAGIIAKVMDIADIEDFRDQIRKGVGFDVYGGDETADKELEAWVADVLSRKDGVSNLKQSVAAKLAELQKLDEHKRSDGPAS